MATDFIPRITRAVQSQIWAIQPEKLNEIALLIAAKAETGKIPTATDIEAMEMAQRGSVRTDGAIAVIPLMGTIARRMGALDAMSGGASVETFMRSFREAMDNPDVRSIAIKFHTPGGSVYGIEEAARLVMAGRKKKRVVAVIDDLAASAGYYIASAADEVVVSHSGQGGSIGVYTIHLDWSEALAGEGIKPTIIKYGDHKAEGNPYEALPEDARAHTESIVRAYGQMFERSVARGRGVSVAEVRENFGQGRTFEAGRLVKLGMADRIATFDETIEDMKSGRGSGGRAQVSVPEMPIAASDEVPTLVALQAQAEQVLAHVAGRADECTSGSDLCEAVSAIDWERAFGAFSADVIEDAVYRDQPAVVDQLTDTAADAATPPTIEPSAAREHAASDDHAAPTSPAPEAREEPMPDSTGTAAPDTPGATTEDFEAVIQRERKRATEIRKLCRAHGIDEARADKWTSDGHSVDRVRGLILEELQNRDDDSPTVQVGATREAEKPFSSFGEQLQAIAGAADRAKKTDPRLSHLNELFAAASGASTGVPADAGFVIQPDFVPGITRKMWDEGRVLSRVNRVPISEGSNRLVRNHLKEHSRKDGSRYGGVRVYRVAEAGTVEGSKPALRRQEISLEKLMGIFYATEETMQDAMALTAEAERGFRSELTFVAENEIFRGTGAGQCLGFMVSNCLVVVDEESGQAADTLVVENAANMLAHLPASSIPTAAWFINQFLIPQLVTLKIGDTPVYLPGGNVAGTGFGTLFGLPVVPVEYCAQRGDQGDIVLADLQQYTAIDKRGVRWQESIHVRFLYDETAFKITYRFNGQPDWDEAVEAFQGTEKISPFITLAART